MKRNLVGLDIGNTSIKIASLRREGDSIILESAASILSPAHGIISSSTIDLSALSDALRQLISTSGIKASDIALSLPESQVYTKVIEMPQLSESELAAALKFEMEQYVPLPIDQVKTDWEILGRSEEGGKKIMNVMLVAAPIQLLEKYQSVMEQAGLTAAVVETEIISVYRSLLPLFSSPYSNMIVHMGATTTTLAIVKAGIIKMVVSLNAGGLAFTRSISIELGIDIAQAENYKKAYGFSKDAFEGKIGNVLVPVIGGIISDIKKAILSFREKNNNESIKQIILSGGSALLPGIDVVLTNELSTQVVLGNSFSAYNIQNVPNELSIEAASYNVVIGLSLRNLL